MLKIEESDEEEVLYFLEEVMKEKKTKWRYDIAYKKFSEWQTSRKNDTISENEIMAYFVELSTANNYSPASLWSIYSMLNTTIKQKHDVSIENYDKLKAFLKKSYEGYRPKKTKMFNSRDIKRFLLEAPDNPYLTTKVAMIFSIIGGCRAGELPYISVNHIEEHRDFMRVIIPETTTNTARSFIIDEPLMDYVKKYSALRPAKTSTNRFFLNCRNGRCTTQVIGKNKFGNMPKEVASYLGLAEFELYSGHSIRGISAKSLANAEIELKGKNGLKIDQIVGGESFIKNEINLPSGNNTIVIHPIKTQTNFGPATVTADFIKMEKESTSTLEYTITEGNPLSFNLNGNEGRIILNMQNCEVHIHNYE